MCLIEKAMETFAKGNAMKEVLEDDAKIAFDYKGTDLSMIENIISKL